jgi:hypothetical protein
MNLMPEKFAHVLVERAASPPQLQSFRRVSLQLHILRLGFLQDGNITVGVFPEGEEVFVGGECPDAGSIGIRAP